MSFANEIRFKHYMVEFDSGRTAHIGGEDVEEVRDYCKQNYAFFYLSTGNLSNKYGTA